MIIFAPANICTILARLILAKHKTAHVMKGEFAKALGQAEDKILQVLAICPLSHNVIMNHPVFQTTSNYGINIALMNLEKKGKIKFIHNKYILQSK